MYLCIHATIYLGITIPKTTTSGGSLESEAQPKPAKTCPFSCVFFSVWGRRWARRCGGACGVTVQETLLSWHVLAAQHRHMKHILEVVSDETESMELAPLKWTS